MLSIDTLKKVFFILPIPSVLLKADSGDYRIVLANSEFAKLVDISENQIVDQDFCTIFDEKIKDTEVVKGEILRQAIDKVIKTKNEAIVDKIHFENKQTATTDVKDCYLKLQIFPVLDEADDVVFVLHTAIDITEASHLNEQFIKLNRELEIDGINEDRRNVDTQKLMEAELQSNNQRYKLVTKATADVIWDWNIETGSLYWGGEINSLFGYRIDSLKPHISSWRSKVHPKDYNKIREQLAEFLSSDQKIWEGEYRFLNASGDYNFVYDRAVVVRDSEGKALRLVGAMQNIHAEKLIELLDKLKLDIGHIFTNIDKLDLCLKNSLKAILEVNNAAYAEVWMTNYNNCSIGLKANYGTGKYNILEDHYRFSIKEGLPGKIWADNKAIIIDNIEESEVFTKKEFARENDYKCVAGYPIPINEKMIAVLLFFYKKEAKISRINALLPKLFNFLGSEIQRKKNEIELDHFFELSPDLMCITNASGNYIKINEAYQNLLGYTKEEMVATNFLTLMHPDDRHIFDDMADMVTSGKIMDHESRLMKKSGEYVWLSWTARPFPGEGLIIAVGKDISDKKSQEEALARSNEKINNILESIQDGFIAINHDWTVSYWNRAVEKIININRDQIIGQNIWEFFPETKKLKFYKEFSRAIEEKVSVRFDEYYKPLNLWMMVSAFPSESGLTVYIKDITENKVATLKLLEFKKVIENSKEEIAIISTVKDGLYLNPAFISSFGFGPEKLKQIGGAQKIFANETQAAEVFSELLAGRHWKGDVELLGKSRKTLSYYISSGPIYDEDDNLIAVFIIHTDISKRKEFETELKTLYSNLQQQAKELANYRNELDQFSHIASKNLNEPLKLISGKLQEFKTQYAETFDEKRLEDIHYAITSSDRIQNLISGLLEYTLSANINGSIEKTDLNKVLKEAKKSLSSRIHDKFAFIDASKLPVIKVHKPHILQIFKTLISTVLNNYGKKLQIQIQVDSNSSHWLFFLRTEGLVINRTELERISNFLLNPDSDMDVSNYLSLATIRKIVGKNKGRLLLEIEANNKSTFSFTIAKDLER